LRFVSRIKYRKNDCDCQKLDTFCRKMQPIENSMNK
jgi:hypothetical protein